MGGHHREEGVTSLTHPYGNPGPVCLLFKMSLALLLYRRCQGAEAFEIQHSGLANGIFMKFLKDRLLEDKKITVLLDEVAEGKTSEKSHLCPVC